MALANLQRYTDAENHPYLNQAAKLFVGAATTYCVLKVAGERNLFYVAAVTAAANGIQSIVANFLTKKAEEKIIAEAAKPFIAPAIDFCILSKLSKMALIRLGVPILSWKLTMASVILSEIFSCLVCPSESQVFSLWKKFQTGELQKQFNNILEQGDV